MTAITEFLFPAPARRSIAAIVVWWERRRIAFNLIVGTAGVLSLGAIQVFGFLPPNPRDVMGLGAPVLVFAVGANAGYTLGPMVEIALQTMLGPRLLPTGPALFRMGLTFSVGLALLPTMIAAYEWVFRLLRYGIFGPP